MTISIIAAMSENRVIGKNNKLPWYIPEDLKHFKDTTLGKPIIMGRRTFESMGKALPGRTNIIVTRNHDYRVAGAHIVFGLKEAIDYCKDQGLDKDGIFIIGGAQIYKDALPLADRIYLTVVHKNIDGDAFFPPIDLKKGFRVVKKIPGKNKNYKFTFLTLEKAPK